MIITAESILAALSGRSFWVETGRGDRSRPEFRRYVNAMLALENELHRIRQLERQELRRTPLPTALGKQSKTSKPLSPFSEIVADAIANMPKIYWSAILWVVDTNRGSYDILASRLLPLAERSAKRDRFWPQTIRRQACRCGRRPAEDYVADLVHLALMELRTPALYQTHEQRAEWFGLSQQHWRKIMQRPYGMLQGKTIEWFGSGCGHINRRLHQRMQFVA